ncbi:MAG: hypothetical protein RLZZ354_68 [Pseudomonadota bacterium]
MKTISLILFSIVGFFTNAQEIDNNEISIYLKCLNWFTTPSEYKANQQIYQNKQPLYSCTYNADSIMNECFVYFENGEVAVHSKTIEIEKVYPGPDSVLFFLNIKDQNTTFYINGKIRSYYINTGVLTGNSGHVDHAIPV